MTDPLTDAYLDAIEQRANAATKGPWEMYRPHHASGFHSVIGGAGGTDNLADDVLEADAEFVAHARSDVPALVAEVRRLRAMEQRVRRARSATSTASTTRSDRIYEALDGGE